MYFCQNIPSLKYVSPSSSMIRALYHHHQPLENAISFLWMYQRGLELGGLLKNNNCWEYGTTKKHPTWPRITVCLTFVSFPAKARYTWSDIRRFELWKMQEMIRSACFGFWCQKGGYFNETIWRISPYIFFLKWRFTYRWQTVSWPSTMFLQPKPNKNGISF